MSRTRPKEKRRGGARDDSNLTICLNRDELAELLERTRRKCEEYEHKQEAELMRRRGLYFKCLIK